MKFAITQDNRIEVDNDILQAVKMVMEGEVFVPEMYLYVRMVSSLDIALAHTVLCFPDQRGM